MESRPATVTKASRAGAKSFHVSLPEEIVFWEILTCLPPKSLLRCRAVCRSWRHATSTRPFLLAHHGRQPNLPVLSGYDDNDARTLLAFDHQATGARLQPIVGLGDSLLPISSCDGLLILSHHFFTNTSYSVCNPATRQHAPLRQLSGFTSLGMYAHRPTDEYRLVLHRVLKGKFCCYIFVLGTDKPPRYIKTLELDASSTFLCKPAIVRDSLHWYPTNYRNGSKVVIVFDTTSESFRHMRAPVVPADSDIFEMDGTLGIYSCSDANRTVDIWVLQNYENEVWAHKYKVNLPAADIKGRSRSLDVNWYISVESVDRDVLLLVSYSGCMFYVNIDGKIVENFYRDGQLVYTCKLRLKQSLVPHTFFLMMKDYAVNASLKAFK
ncbi:unnamed protein product [Alopecurus aequalis]